jgi:hypothetical protein
LAAAKKTNGSNNPIYDVGSFLQGYFMLQMNLWDKTNKIKWNILVVYGAAHDKQKLDFLSELSSFCSRNSDPILIGGDFNIIRFAHVRNRHTGVQRFSDLFNTLVDFHELKEIEMSGGTYSLSNDQEIPTLGKLDRILVSKDWEELFPHVCVRKLPREVSDHSPLILSSGLMTHAKKIEFRFELSWLSNDFFSAVNKIWNKPCRAVSALDKIQQKLKLLKQYFKGWGFNL